MKIIGESEMAARLDFMRPLHPSPEPPGGVWCIPFEWGANEKGTRISIAKAKEIAAVLRASIAEAEMRQLRKAFEEEQARTAKLVSDYSEASDARYAALAEVATLKQKLRRRKAARSGSAER